MVATVGCPVNPAPRIAVAGTPGSGVSTLAATLTSALPDHDVVEWTARQCGETPDVVVFTVTAAAPMTASQWALLGSVLKITGQAAVVVAVSKIDLHRDWADVLEVNRRTWVADRVAPTWVAVAADPDIGDPQTDGLIDAVRHCRPRRAPVRDRRAQAIEGRGELAQARLRLSRTIRSGCAELRGELHHQATRLDRRGLRDFRERALVRIAAAVAEWDQAMSEEFDAIMRGSGIDVAAFPDEPPPAPFPAALPDGLPGADPTEVRLTMLIGVVFGLGAALTASRLLAGVVEGWAPAAGAVVGLGLALWVIGARRLLSDRAAALRWTADVLAGARHTLEERVASRALVVEVAIGLAVVDRR